MNDSHTTAPGTAPPRSRHPARVLAVAAVAGLALALVGSAHWWLARRLLVDPGIPAPLRVPLLVGVGLLGLLFLAGFPAERLLANPWRRRVCLASFTWMGVLWIALVVLALSEVVFWLLGAAAAPREAAVVRAVSVAGLVAVATAVGLRSGLGPPRLRRVEVRLDRWPAALDGLRIVQISDIHIGPILDRRFAAALVERVNALAPDLVAVTGDLVDGEVDRLRDEVAPFAGLRARHGVYFVTGNHDVYSGDAAWVGRVRELGWRPLRNERVAIEHSVGVFDLAGVDDHRGDWLRGTTEDLPAALAGRDPERPVVLLAHDPSTFVEAAARGVDLQLSGHTHGGQIQPFGALVRLAVPWVAGLHRRGASQLYVSRGTGFWGPPLRLFAPAEITHLTLRPQRPS